MRNLADSQAEIGIIHQDRFTNCTVILSTRLLYNILHSSYSVLKIIVDSLAMLWDYSRVMRLHTSRPERFTEFQSLFFPFFPPSAIFQIRQVLFLLYIYTRRCSVSSLLFGVFQEFTRLSNRERRIATIAEMIACKQSRNRMLFIFKLILYFIFL